MVPLVNAAISACDQKRVPVEREIGVDRQEGAADGACGDPDFGLLKIGKVHALGVIAGKRGARQLQEIARPVLGKAAGQDHRIQIKNRRRRQNGKGKAVRRAPAHSVKMRTVSSSCSP